MATPQKHDRLPVVWRGRAFDGAFQTRYFDPRRPVPTIAEIVASIGDLPRGFVACGEVRINGEIVPRAFWHLARPRYRPGFETVVWLGIPLRGGSSSGPGGQTKNPLATIASIAVLLVAAAVTGGAAAGLGGIFGGLTAGSIGASVAGAAIGIGGALAIAALIPPPTLSGNTGAGAASAVSSSSTNPGAAALSGNLLSPGASMPRVVGTMRVFPPFLCNPLIEVVGDTEIGEAVYGLCGPHALADIRVGDTSIDTIAEVQSQTIEGKTGDYIQSMVTRQSFTLSPNAELSGHTLDETAQNKLADQANPSADIPQPQAVVSRKAPDELWINLQWPEGLFKADATTAKINQAVRVRIRLRGATDFINLPEVHFSQNQPGTFQKVIRLKWGAYPAFPNPAPADQGPVYVFKAVPGQDGVSVSPATAGWTAHGWFSNGIGNDVLSAATIRTSNVANTELHSDKAIFYLDPEVFPKGYYECDIVRSTGYDSSSFVPATYRYSGQVYDFFGYSISGGAAVLPMDHAQYHDRVLITRVSSIWNQNPVQTADFATISVKVHSRSLDQLSVLASGLVPDWNGSEWSGLAATSNPAPHFRDVMAGSLGNAPVPVSMINNDEIVRWRASCDANGYTCNAVIQGKNYIDVLNMIAGTGYATLRTNERWGVFEDMDTSAFAPRQIFTPRNMANFNWTRAFANRPTGIRAGYVDAGDNYNTDASIIVYDDLSRQDADDLDQVSYDGLVLTDDVVKRARYDLAQSRLRMTFYQGDADLEAIACQRGDLIGVQHDILMRNAGFSRIKSIMRTGGEVRGLVLDGSIPVNATPGIFTIAHLFAEDHIFLLGQRTGIAIRLPDGAGVLVKEVTGASNGDLTEIEFVAPVGETGDILAPDCLVTAGPLGFAYKRLKVFGIEPKNALQATVTMVDEAPALWK
ncbi:hypothetical protein [Bradyrhizobium sp. G127]|uniref:hypothetical protein n=1 Tax=Bradyrhizobium sp. G127 TaxID=2904800 RepID=UPI001F258BC3|nr:hypothetical protein [Bradyrhizobium sp. G127]MCF2522352.1 hypothetical protein [Bradyrhizobium sp. G127]